MKVFDTMDGIEKLLNSYSGNIGDILPLWREYISTYPKIEKLCFNDMVEDDSEDRVMAIMHGVFSNEVEIIKEAHQNFVKVIDVVREPFTKICNGIEDIDIYFYVGLCNGAGWATVVNGRGTILIGAEKIAELKWHTYNQMLGLVSHELSHEAHRVIRDESIDKEFDNEEDKWIWRLYSEGFAQRVQQMIQNNDTYHQYGSDWLEFAKKNIERLKSVYRLRLHKNESLQDFYGDWHKFEGYADMGYYLGSIWIDELLEDYSMNDIAHFSINKIKELIYVFLRN